MNNDWEITTDHQKIRDWAEMHFASPEIVDDFEAGSDKPVLRLDFPGEADDIFLPNSSKDFELTWEEFFRRFEEENYAFEYIPNYGGESPDWAYKFVKREEVKGLNTS